MQRRTFYIGAIYGLGGVIASALGLPAAAYLLFPPKGHKEEEWIDVGDISRLEMKQPVEVVFRRNRWDGWRLVSEKSTAWVVKLAENKVVAFGPQCTHLGCAHHWDTAQKQFLCPCHTSLFSLEGAVTAGPAPRPLDRFDIRIEGGKLLLGRLRESTEVKA